MKTHHTNEEIQAAIDAACKATASGALRPSFALLRLIESDTTDDWSKETPARLHLLKSALTRLPEPPPPVVDGKTPEELLQSVYYSTPAAEFPFRKAASAVLAAFGGAGLEQAIARMEAVPWKELDKAWDNAVSSAVPFPELKVCFESVRARLIAAAREGQPASQPAEIRAEKAEAELALMTLDYDKCRRERGELLNQRDQLLARHQLSTLRPIAEAGEVPAGAVRVFASKLDGWKPKTYQITADTHFADIILPKVKAPAVAVEAADKPMIRQPRCVKGCQWECTCLDSELEWTPPIPAKPAYVGYMTDEMPTIADPYAELKAAHTAGKVIQHLQDGVWWDFIDPSGPAYSDPPNYYRIKPAGTFESHGKTWMRHTPGDPMPCDGKEEVEYIMESNLLSTKAWPAKDCRWDAGTSIIGWRYADEPTPEEPVKPWTPAVGDVVTLKSGGLKMTLCSIRNDSVGCEWHDDSGVPHARHYYTAALQPA